MNAALRQQLRVEVNRAARSRALRGRCHYCLGELSEGQVRFCCKAHRGRFWDQKTRGTLEAMWL